MTTNPTIRRLRPLLALAVAACAAVTPSRPPATSPAPALVGFATEDDIRAMLQAMVADPTTTGVVVGLVDSAGTRRVLAHGSGGTGAPRDGGSVFEIGSITKVFTGILLSEMALRGEVAASDPLSRHLPPVVRVPSLNGREITLLDLASMTSGLPGMPRNFPAEEDSAAYANYTMNDVYRFLSGYALPREPGPRSSTRTWRRSSATRSRSAPAGRTRTCCGSASLPRSAWRARP